jgi:ADP-heptose:LPS heptosyltransferase
VSGWPDASEVDSLLAVKFGLLGDLLLADPALVALRARYPKARLRLLTDAAPHAAWLRPGTVDEIQTVFIGVHRPTYRRLYDPRLWRDVLTLRRQPASALAVFLNDTLGGYQRRLYASLARASRARWRVGARTRETGYLTDGPALEELAGLHETERGWRIAGGSGPAPLPRLPDPDPASVQRVRETRTRVRPRFTVALQPLTAKPAKQWPPPRFVELARRLVEASDALVVLVGSSREAEAAPAFRGLGDRVLEAFGQPISGLVGTLQECDAFVGHDSGPFHVAVAAGRPSVVLVGPGDPKYYRYRRPTVRSLRRCVRATGEGECPLYLSCRDPRCLPSLTVDEVLAALAELGVAERARP